MTGGVAASRIVEVDGLNIAFRRHGIARDAAAPPLLYLQGATFPGGLAVGWRFDGGASWADDLTGDGQDLWSMDYAGFGDSDRYPAMSRPPTPGALGRSDAVVRQVAAIVEAIRAETGRERLAILAHSWGGVVACRLAAARPDLVARLCLFAPVLRRASADAADPAGVPSWISMTLDAQLQRFRAEVPPGEPLYITDEMFAHWAKAYLATDAANPARAPDAVAIPSGGLADIAAAWRGDIPYDPARIACPVAIVRGEWDQMCTDADVEAFRRSLSACPAFQDAKLEKGTHLMHLETGRARLWAATRQALARA